MRTHHIFTILSAVIVVVCAIIAILNYSLPSNAKPQDEVREQMEKEILNSLDSMVRYAEVTFNHGMPLT